PAELGVLPARPHLEGAQLPGLQVDDGLEAGDDLGLGQGPGELVTHVLGPAQDAGADAPGDADAVPAGALGPVHAPIGGGQQGVGVDGDPGPRDGEADAGGDPDPAVAHHVVQQPDLVPDA